MPITAPTPPTPPTPPQKLESKTNWAVELHPPVPHFSFGNRKSAPVEEVEEYSEEEFVEEESESEVESEPAEVVEDEPNPLQVARDRVQTYHRSEDGSQESTSTQSREPIQTNNRIPGEVRPEELTRDAADARGKLIVEQFRKLEEMKDQQKESQQNQKATLEVPRINPSDHKSSLGTAIFTFAAILVLVIVAFFTLRRSRLQKHREEIDSKKDLKTSESVSKSEQKNESIQDPIPEPIHIAPKIPATKIKSAYSNSTSQSKPQSKPQHKTQLNTELINAKLNSQQKSQPKSAQIPTAKIKSVDRNPSDGKTHFEVRI